MQWGYEPAPCDTETTVAFICLKKKTNRCEGFYADINLQISLGALIFESVMSSVHEAAICRSVRSISYPLWRIRTAHQLATLM